MKEFTNMAGCVTSFAGRVIFFALAGYHDQGHDLSVFQFLSVQWRLTAVIINLLKNVNHKVLQSSSWMVCKIH